MEVFEDTNHKSRMVVQKLPDDTFEIEVQPGSIEKTLTMVLRHEDQKRLAFALLEASMAEEPNDILDELQGLYLQATRERSHYYVGRVAQAAIVKIKNLRRDVGKTDYEEALESHLSHVRDLDVSLNGEIAAKRRPSMIHLKPQLMACIAVFRWVQFSLKRAKHKKRQSFYRMVSQEATLQMKPDSLKDGDPMTVYIAEEDGKLYVRGSAEFDDGRFEKL